MDVGLEAAEPVADVRNTSRGAVLHRDVQELAVELDVLLRPAAEGGLEVQRDRVEGEGSGVGASGAGVSRLNEARPRAPASSRSLGDSGRPDEVIASAWEGYTPEGEDGAYS